LGKSATDIDPKAVFQKNWLRVILDWSFQEDFVVQLGPDISNLDALVKLGETG